MYGPARLENWGRFVLERVGFEYGAYYLRFEKVGVGVDGVVTGPGPDV